MPAADHVARLKAALHADPVDMSTLIEIARTHGLGDDNALRRRAWPLLLGLQPGDSFLVGGLAVAPDEKTRKVVDVDVPRSMHSYDVTKAFDDDKRESMRATLKELIYKSLDLGVDPVTAEARPRPRLHYYQGYHDVVSVFQLVLGPRLGEMCVRRAAFFFLRDSMRRTMDATMDVLEMVFPLVRLRDPAVAAFLERSGVQALVATPWLLTWFAHSVDELGRVARLFDFFLASPPIMSVYFIAALILNAKAALLPLECETASVHAFLQNDVVRPDSLEPACRTALRLLRRTPPDVLRAYVAKTVPKRPAPKRRRRQAPIPAGAGGGAEAAAAAAAAAAKQEEEEEAAEQAGLQLFHNTPVVEEYVRRQQERRKQQAAHRARLAVAVVSVLAVVVGMGVAYYRAQH